MGVLEKHLHSRTFLVGNSVTLADIVGTCNLYWGYTKVRSHSICDKLLKVCTGGSWQLSHSGRHCGYPQAVLKAS